MSQPLQPPFISNFFLGLPRRVEELIESFEDEHGMMTEHERSAVEKLVHVITDQLSIVLKATMALGYPPITELDGAESEHSASIDTRSLEAGALQLGQQVAGTPITAWARHPDELEQLRSTVDQIAEVLRIRD